MPTVPELFNRSPTRLWLVGFLLLLVAMPVALFAWNLFQVSHGEYENVPLEILRTGDIELIREFQEQYSRDPAGPPLEIPSGEEVSGVPETPESMRSAAYYWVHAINHYNPDAIIFHDTDPIGNLYLLLGGWWLELSPRHQLEALDSLGRFWRSYLYDTFGDWDPDNRGEFAPGIILVDGEGDMFARNIDGRVELMREPVYPTH